ncbi:membrane protein insertase YidC [Enterobacterales bacterium endosymbiont of Anomoneura mori]|uniref:membrane protein insertase YidC n=1 Tax=Enterobacterales bacterium endosymbiont of Anomoneura mori TaxID=3132096 RepID=UPI00399CDAF1
MNIKNKLLILILFLFVITLGIFKKKENIKNCLNINQNENIINYNYDNIINNRNKSYKKIIIKTDLLNLTINTNGGIIEEAKLLKYKEKINSCEYLKLLKTNNSFIYQIKNNIIKKNFLFKNKNKIINPNFKIEKDNYILKNNENFISIPMYYKDNNGNIIIKTFILKRNSYEIKILNTFINNSKFPIKLNDFGQIKQTINLSNDNILINNNSKEIAFSTDKEKIKKISFKNDIKYNVDTKTGWIAMLQKYFITSLIPNNKKNILNFKKINNNLNIISYQSNSNIIKPYNIKNFKTSLWIGPKLQDEFIKISPYLNLTINYGFFGFLSHPIFKILKFINKIIGNWGFSIILITLLLRLIIYPITNFQYIYANKINLLNPKIKKIKEIYKNNKLLMNKEIFKLYKNEKINPLLGLLSVIIQIPIFLSLYNILIESIELRHSKFIFWINDLSSKDPYFILPIILSITIYYIQKISYKSKKNTFQEKIINFLPLLFSIFFYYFPSGIIIYYIINNIFIIFQQKKIYKKFFKKYK